MMGKGWAFAFKNVFRQKSRTFGTLLSIVLGVSAMILAGGFVQDIFWQLGEAVIHSQSGHIQIHAKGYSEGKVADPAKFEMKNTEELKKRAANIEHVVSAFARMEFSGILNNGKRDFGIIGEGVEPDAESALGTYMKFVEGRALKNSDGEGMVIGSGVAQMLGLKVGDRASLVVNLSQGAVNTLDFEVVGIFKSFSKEFDSRAIRIPLSATKTLLDTESSHSIVMVLDQTENTAKALGSVRSSFPPNEYESFSWIEMSDFYSKTIDMYDRQFGFLRLIILLMVILSVSNSINMTLFERTKEFGTMMATGDSPGKVFRLILSESAILGAIGSVAGMLLGCALGLLISEVGIPMPPPPNADLGYVAYIRIVPADVAISGMIGFVASCLASILPARKVIRTEIVDALRHGV